MEKRWGQTSKLLEKRWGQTSKLQWKNDGVKPQNFRIALDIDKKLDKLKI